MSIDPDVIDKLREILGDEGVFDSAEKRIAYSSDASKVSGELPGAVARPQTTEQVSRILKVANSTGIPVYPRGAGSGLTGGAVPLRGGIVLDFEMMNRILEIDADNMTALVQPGVITADLHDGRDPCLDKMQRTGCRHLPVLADGHVIAMLSMRDLLWDEIAEQIEEIRHLRAYVYQTRLD